MEITPHVVEQAAQAMVRTLWREFQRRNPNQTNPVPAYDELRPRDRDTFNRVAAATLAAAVRAATPDA